MFNKFAAFSNISILKTKFVDEFDVVPKFKDHGKNTNRTACTSTSR